MMNIPVITNAKRNLEAMKVMQFRGSVPDGYQYFRQQPSLAEAIEEYIRCYAIPLFLRGDPETP